MSTPAQKRASADSLRWYADMIEPALDAVPGLSHDAWDCPAADSFNSETATKRSSLEAAAGSLRTVAWLLDQAADAQEAEAAAAAAAAAAVAATSDIFDGGSATIPIGMS